MIFVESVTKGGTRIDLVFDSYLDRFIKDSERKKRAKKSPIELHNIERKTPLPVEMDRFWPSSKNKAGLENLIHQEAQSHSWNKCITEVFISGFEFSLGFNTLSYKLFGGSLHQVPELDLNIEEADLRNAVHALHATKEALKQLVVLSADSDVFILLVHY